MSDERVVDHFGAIAQAYREVRAPAELHGAGIPELVEAADLRGRRILDVGCGTRPRCARTRVQGAVLASTRRRG